MWTMMNWMMCNDWNTEDINADIAFAIMSQLSGHMQLIFGVQSPKMCFVWSMNHQIIET
jgi:hypothetical protein